MQHWWSLWILIFTWQNSHINARFTFLVSPSISGERSHQAPCENSIRGIEAFVARSEAYYSKTKDLGNHESNGASSHAKTSPWPKKAHQCSASGNWFKSIIKNQFALLFTLQNPWIRLITELQPDLNKLLKEQRLWTINFIRLIKKWKCQMIQKVHPFAEECFFKNKRVFQ